MPVHRKRFRIEEGIVVDVPVPAIADSGEPGPMHGEIMAELRARMRQAAEVERVFTQLGLSEEFSQVGR